MSIYDTITPGLEKYEQAVLAMVRRGPEGGVATWDLQKAIETDEQRKAYGTDDTASPVFQACQNLRQRGIIHTRGHLGWLPGTRA